MHSIIEHPTRPDVQATGPDLPLREQICKLLRQIAVVTPSVQLPERNEMPGYFGHATALLKRHTDLEFEVHELSAQVHSLELEIPF
jgi:hypothetical protein